MPIHSRNSRLPSLLLAALLSLSSGAQAHDDEHAVVPDTAGGRLRAQVVLAQLNASELLPSQGLPGLLMRGDPGVDQRGGQLEHGVLAAGWRFNPAWSAELAVGAHGRDPSHLEAASLRWQQQRGALAWSLALGRQSPAQGPVIGPAGHLDRFGLMPLAKAAQTDGDWIADGLQASLQLPLAGLDWRADLGLWSGRGVPGRMFPAGQDSPVAPSLHLGLSGDGAWGDWALDAFAADIQVRSRGSRFISSSGAHSHQAPACDTALNQVVCFDGDARLRGLSAQWRSAPLPLSVSAALLWRNESGDLQSRNGQGSYRGRNRGGWLQALWQLAPAWEAGLRHERLSARQALIGPGANLLALDAGLDRYAPLQRSSLMLAWRCADQATLYLEAGQERADANGGQRSSYTAVRLALSWERGEH
ncbi:hypothetical protein RQP53_17405 [Paucibacter sp. APW11]|uniref:Capsule assembly Wzi family protein n=1 Tax=Roseateles aquae TaxID=3077235 RepID=A0ABU3PES3_9BURK|nr:hypothetical protein [Paucibacter sp. APW11]MDT9001059.1 hypothetical protein [Paucibacter sp. APW11]